ncbi:MAG TPA: hypothetical protein DD713_02745 [Nitrospiraceae bacterium]|nr:hypothetical protein [Nitrospiraceae bacterium]
MNYSLSREPINKIPTNVIIQELQQVAKHYNYQKFTRHEFDKISVKCKGSVVLDRFGTWENALKTIGNELKARVKKSKIQISNEELFAEMERIWSNLGHRPSKNEWDNSNTKYSYTTYKTRFHGWVNACGKFIEYKNKDSKTQNIQNDIVETPKLPKKEIPSQNIRGIPDKLRIKILKRDNFKCVYCGKSPATHHGITLHIDHVIPFSKNGKTVFENLQTLCQNCNWGKGTDNL